MTNHVSDHVLLLIITILLPTITLSYPYGYYGAYSRTRRDPGTGTAWNGGYGGLVQQNQMGNYGGQLDNQGIGMGGAYPQAGNDNSMYGINQYGQGVVDNSRLNPMMNRHLDPSLQASMGNMHHVGDPNAYQQSEQQYPKQVNSDGDLGDSQGPSECRGEVCQNLNNCIKVSMNDTKCCPTCAQYGCICEGYQVYDCQLNGFREGMVPEGKSYAVADNTTVCSCPPGGGAITCSFHDRKSSRCPETTQNCVETFIRDLDGCEECSMVGCISDTGAKVEAGSSVAQPPCSICYCPHDGGKLYCGTDKACEAKLQENSGSNHLAMESSIRELNPLEHEQGAKSSLGPIGNGGYNGYGGYQDYGGQYGAVGNIGLQGGGAPVIPPLMPLGGSDGKSKVGTGDTGTKGDLDSTGGKDPGTGQLPYGPYQQGYNNMGYQGQYNGYGQRGQGSYGQGGQGGSQGYGTGYLGYGGVGGYGTGQYGYDQQMAGYPQQGAGVGGSLDSTDSKLQDGDKDTSEAAGTDAPNAGQGVGGAYRQAGGYPYGQGGAAGYSDYGSVQQQPYVPPLMGGYPSYSNQEGVEQSSGSSKNEANKQDIASEASISKQGVTGDGGSPHQQAKMGQNLGYPYQGYGKGGYYQQYNPFQGYGQYPSQPDTPGQGTAQDSEMDRTKSQTRDSSQDSNLGQAGSYGQGYGQGGGYNQYLGSYGPYGYGNQYGNYGNQLGNGAMGVNNPAAGIGPVDATGTASEGQYDSDSKSHDSSLSKESGLNQPQSVDKLSELAAGYNNAYQTQYGPGHPYDQQQQPGYPNYAPNTVGSQYEPVDPALMNAGSPNAYGPASYPENRNSKTSEDEALNKIANSASRKIRDNLSTIHKNRHSHEKASPAIPSTTTTIRPKPKKKAKKKSAKQASYENVLSICCYSGRQWALQHKTCIGIPVNVNTYSQICAVVQEKCCLEAKEQEFCQGGIDTARSMAACDVPASLGGTCGANEFKTCCDCCAMGMKALSLGINCDVKIFGEPCNRAYMECCQERKIDSDASQLPDLTPTANSKEQGHDKPLENAEPTGPHCSSDSECQQICKDTAAGMLCSCRPGYVLHRNKKDCNDVNECIHNTHTCTENQICLNNEGSFTCQRRISCGTGYELTERNTCEDIDECALAIHDCFGNMDCENIRGSYRCTPKLCDEGFFTDATGRCIDIDECRAGDYICPKGASCVNTDGSYECPCPAGFEADSDNVACEDINECLSGDSPCAEGATCINTEGSFVCREPPKLRCSPGYQPNDDVTECIDIDECTEGTHTCNAGSTCINADGGFRCQDPLVCAEGLEPDEDQQVCLDIDECKDPLRHRCDVGGRCRNLHKSFTCVCDSGYVHAEATDGVPTCVDVDECSVGDTCKYKCRNTPGSYECYCPDGYKLSEFGSSCEDIDECSHGTFPCSGEETCFNTFGSFRCVALTCPTGYTKISNKRTNLSCLRPCTSRPCSSTTLYRYLHIAIPSLPNASAINPRLVLRIRQNFPSSNFTYNIANGNTARNFRIKKTTIGGELEVVRPLLGPWETVLTIVTREKSKFSGAVKNRVAVIYVYVYQNQI